MWAGEHRPLRHSRGPRKPQVLPMDASRFVHFPHLDGQPRAASGPGAVGARAEAGPGRAVSAWDPASLQSLEKAPALLQKASSEMSPRRLLRVWPQNITSHPLVPSTSPRVTTSSPLCTSGCLCVNRGP